MELQRNGLDERSGKAAIEGKSPVVETSVHSEMDPEYGGTRETLSEAGRTISQG